jgi:subtilisin family serine protease
MNKIFKTFTLSIALTFLIQDLSAQAKYWVRFTNKNGTPYSISNPSAFLTNKSIQRRTTYSIAVDQTDLPVTPSYVQQVESVAGVTVLYASKWINGVAIIATNTAALNVINSFSFVAGSAPVNRFRIVLPPVPGNDGAVQSGRSMATKTSSNYYGGSLLQAQQLGVDCIHSQGYRGQGMTIAVLDAGFYKADVNRAFDSLRNRSGILGTRDFVTGGNSVYEDDAHGAEVLSCMAALIPDTIVGSAPRANFWLLRTEDANTETPSEEYNWIRGAEFADSVGADIFTTSLGYTQFDNSIYDHTYATLNGKTAYMSIAATMAARKGVLVLNAAGNEGDNSWHYISVPADADSIITVGAIDGSSNMASFSSYGPTADGRIKPDLTARGLGSWVMDPYSMMPQGGSGTSFATPILAGAVACFWQAHPNLRNITIIDTLRKTASFRHAPDNHHGWGTPNMCLILSGIKEQSKNSFNFNVMPNPFKSSVKIQIPIEAEMQIRVQNVLGQTAKATSIKTSGNEFEYDLSDLNSGIYFISLSAPSLGTVTKKIIKE